MPFAALTHLTDVARAALLLLVLTANSHAQTREIAITIDDLPVSAALRQAEPSEWQSVTLALVGVLARHAIPAVGFVNEGVLVQQNRVDPARLRLLRHWLDAGLELGNHTYSHLDYHAVPIDSFFADVVRGDVETTALRSGRAPLGGTWFRHPYLHTGLSIATRDSLNRFLAGRGFRVAPVTIDNADYVFAEAYERAFSHGDTLQTNWIAAEYVSYLEACVAYYERQAQQLFGREIRQVLLIHASRLNADVFETVVARLRQRGYRFVTLDRAVADSAYLTPNQYVGPGGISWIHRWALTAGKRGAFFAGEPEVPSLIVKAASRRPNESRSKR
jgi:peptidoglycan/xylan/chitin deacetylase (PgdA/CDA1 family)